MGKKKFIDKKKSATFQLIARDSADPNFDDGPSGDRVFVRIDNNPYSLASFDEPHEAQFAADTDSVFADAPEDCEDGGGGSGRILGSGFLAPPLSGAAPLPDHVRREILELGFPDDGYNYLLHLRDIKNTGGGSAYYHNSKAKLDQLPNDVKAYDASRVQISHLSGDPSDKSIYSVASKTVGVRIQKAVDPEVAALLDDSDFSRFGSDVEDLEEDFVVKANLAELQDFEFAEKTQKSEISRSELLSVGANNAGSYTMDARKSSIDEIPRVRRLLDEQFDLLELREYGTNNEDEYNDSLAEENENHESLAQKLQHAFEDTVMGKSELNDKYKFPANFLHDKSVTEDSLGYSSHVVHRCKEYAKKYENDGQDEDEMVLQESSDESEVWDCDSVISTYSNLDNHPGKIEAPQMRRKKLTETFSGASSASGQVISLRGKEKLPVDFLPHSRKSATEKVKDASRLRTEQQKTRQHGHESKEEKKERKAAVKEERREARRMKKEMKGIYKCESQHAQKVAAFSGPSSIHLK